MNRFWTRDVNFAVFEVASANIIIFYLLIFYLNLSSFCTSDSVLRYISNEKRKKMRTWLKKSWYTWFWWYDGTFRVIFFCIKPHSSTQWFLAIGGQLSCLDHVVVRPSWTLKKEGGGAKPDKGQIISKANFEVFIWTKNRTKIFLYFCPRSLKWTKSKKEYKLLY